MKGWIVENGFDINFYEAPEWATKLAWRRLGTGDHGPLLRAWVDENNTKYQYLRGFSGVSRYDAEYQGDFLNADWEGIGWNNPAKVIATLYQHGSQDVIPERKKMVCHDEFGFMTEEFQRYSQKDWDTTREYVKGVITKAIWDGVCPIAMKELLTAAIDCGTTLAKTEMKVESFRK